MDTNFVTIEGIYEVFYSAAVDHFAGGLYRRRGGVCADPAATRFIAAAL
jgi:hypothetical protein